MTFPRLLPGKGRIQIAILSVLAIALGLALVPGLREKPRDPAPAEYAQAASRTTPPLGDVAGDLQRRIESGEINLEFDPEHGYLPSLLDHLKIPVSSQVLVFTKSSLQRDLVSPATPRAIYFNDEAYVGAVQGGSTLEIASVDSQSGPVFYTLPQQEEERPKIERQTSTCLVCHDSSQSKNP